MKILLQPEARTISNDKLAKNQEFLIRILTGLSHFKFKASRKQLKT